MPLGILKNPERTFYFSSQSRQASMVTPRTSIPFQVRSAGFTYFDIGVSLRTYRSKNLSTKASSPYPIGLAM